MAEVLIRAPNAGEGSAARPAAKAAISRAGLIVLRVGDGRRDATLVSGWALFRAGRWGN